MKHPSPDHKGTFMDNPNSGRSGRRLRRIAALATVAVLGATTLAAPAVAKPAKDRDTTKTNGRWAADSVDPATLPLGSMYHVVDQIGARALWNLGYTGAGVNVAVIDTGVAQVAALSGTDKVVAMVDLSAEAGVPEAVYQDTYGHGTHMMGIIAGRTPGATAARAKDNPQWFMGVAPDAGLISVKAGDNTGAVDVSQIIAGIDWVTEHADELDIRVLNLSFTSDTLQEYLTDPLTHAVERAWRAGIVVVVAAGNDGLGQTRLGVPANDPYVIAVGGLRADGNGAFSSPSWATNGNGVRNPDVGAPGAGIISLRAPGSRVDIEYPGARVGDHLFRGSGSSQAAAVVSGAAALLLDAKPWLTPDQVKVALRRSADANGLPLGHQMFAGQGLVRVDRALNALTSGATQYHLPATGLGSLHSSRGSLPPVEVLGVPVLGETTVLGTPWLGGTWIGDRWTDGTWDGVHWSNGAWLGAEWTGVHWSGVHWSGLHWSGVHWSGVHWSNSAWSGSSWTGSSWSGVHWSGVHWSGVHWSNSSWL